MKIPQTAPVSPSENFEEEVVEKAVRKEARGELARWLKIATSEFYSWTPDNPKPGYFRCHHQGSRPLTKEEICRSRATKPDLYSTECAGCPRWKFYRKELKPKKVPFLG